MTEDEFYDRMAVMWYDTFGRSSFRNDRLTPVECMLFQFYMMDSGGRPADFLRYAHERAKLFLSDKTDSGKDCDEMFRASTSGPDVSVDDEDFEEYEAAQQEKYEREKTSMAAIGLSITDTRSPMEQWGITDSNAMTEEQSEEQTRWWRQRGRWLEEL